MVSYGKGLIFSAGETFPSKFSFTKIYEETYDAGFLQYTCNCSGYNASLAEKEEKKEKNRCVLPSCYLVIISGYYGGLIGQGSTQKELVS